MPASRIKAIGRRKFATKYAAARPPETNHLIRRGELRLFGTLPRLHRKRSRLRVYRFPGTSNGPCSALPERDLNLLSHHLIDAAVPKFGPTEIFPHVAAMHRAIPVSATACSIRAPARFGAVVRVAAQEEWLNHGGSRGSIALVSRADRIPRAG